LQARKELSQYFLGYDSVTTPIVKVQQISNNLLLTQSNQTQQMIMINNKIEAEGGARRIQEQDTPIGTRYTNNRIV